MVRAQLAMHPRTFAVAITGAAVFALATVASSLAIAVGHRPHHHPALR